MQSGPPLFVQSGALEGPRTGSQTSYFTRRDRRLEFPKESAASVRETEPL